MQKLYHGGTILPMTGEENYAEALLTEGDKILAVGDCRTLKEMAKDPEEIDLAGACLMPAFIDPHSHFSQLASGLAQADFTGVTSIEEMRERISCYMQEKSPKAGEWIIAHGYDNNRFPGGKNPPLSLIDSLVENNPLIIMHKSGHMGLLNSLALRKAGITPESTAPEGGRIGKENGRLTGYLEENAFIEVLRKAPLIKSEGMTAAYEAAQQKYASYGIATVQEGVLSSQLFPLYKDLFASGRLKLDLVGYLEPSAYEKAKATFPESFGRYHQHFKVGGVKIYLDGSPQGRTAWMREPYEGESDYRAYGTMTDETVTAVMEKAAEEGVQLLAHCNGDAAAAQMIRCLRVCEEKHPEMKNLRPVMIHAQLLGRDQIPEMGPLGLMPSFFVAHVYHWGDVHLKNFGPERAENISAAKTALQEGIPFTFHQDSPVIEPDMLETVWCAVNRRTLEGRILGEAQRISTYDALKAVTVNAAYQYFEEDRKGTLEPGKQADLVILSADPLKAPAEEIRDIRVLKTIKSGEVLYSTE